MLRAHADRLVCDACEGIMLAHDDFVAAVAQIANMEPQIEILPRKAPARACPRCPQQMAGCRLRISFPIKKKQKKPRVTLDRCDAHGLWFDGTELAKIFEIASKMSSSGPRGGGSGGGGRGPTVSMPGAGRGWGFGV